MFRNLIRILGLTGLLVAGAGTAVLVAQGSDWNITAHLAGESDRLAAKPDNIGAEPLPILQIASIVLVTGVAFAGIALLVEILSAVRNSAGRRSALGGNVFVQIGLAVALLIAVNIWSTTHWHRRWDCTRDGSFTLKKDLKEQLSQIRDETTVVVYLMHKTFGRFSDKPPDEYDTAAEAKVVEKVKDLVDELRGLGSRFRVVVLDVQERDFNRKLEEEVKHFPDLADAIKSAPENSVFFCSGDQKQRAGSKEYIQRLGFNEFYQLDKTASKEANGGRGNLVLLYQGIDPFARRVLGIEEKKPRIGVAVTHGLLSTRGSENDFTMAGVRKSLTANGFDVVDIVLKRWAESLPEPEPTAYTFDENRFDFLEEQLADLNQGVPLLEREREAIGKRVKALKESTLDELNTLFKEELNGRSLSESDRKVNLDRLEAALTFLNSELETAKEERTKYEKEFAELSRSEGAVEGRRITDVKAKFRRLLSECDMLILPRITLISIINGWAISPAVHKLSEPQVDAIREFIQSGKPVFVLFGPTNQPASRALAPQDDNLESMLGELGFVFGQQTILFNAETKAFAERRSNPIGSGLAVEIPPVEFENHSGTAISKGDEKEKENPIANSLKITTRSVGQKLDLTIRHPRPIYFSSVRPKPDFQTEFLFTDSASWNEEKPFPDRNYTPRFDPSANKDPNKSLRDLERRGPFAIGLAIQTNVPPEWLDPKYRAFKVTALVSAGLCNMAALPTGLATEAMLPTDDYTSSDPKYKAVPVRLIAIGQGGVFNSADASHPDLTPAKEELLLTACNWLLKRDSRLPHADREWEYPRVNLSAPNRMLWHFGTIFGLPFFFAWLGAVVLLVRRIR